MQLAFYGGYFAMAFPAAIFIKKFSYKSGVLLGLLLYAIGAFLFFPAAKLGAYYPFLAAYFVLTCGLSFLETSANPYILTMGPEENATRRLNMAQAFNPIGSLMGMYVAMNFIQAKLNPMSTSERAMLSDSEFETVKQSDLAILVAPYLAIGIVVLIIFTIILLARMPKNEDEENSLQLGATLKRIFSKTNYRRGVIAQFFYIGAQIMCWTFIIQYGTHILMMGGMEEQAAEVLSQKYNIIAMIIFCCSRLIATYLMKFFEPGKMLTVFAIAAGLFTLGVILLQNIWGLYSLVAISVCMSLMFPTIYGKALEGMSSDVKFGAAGLIMAILGGSVLPPLQASIIDLGTIGNNFPAVNASFILPLICFVVVGLYGKQSYSR